MPNVVGYRVERSVCNRAAVGRWVGYIDGHLKVPVVALRRALCTKHCALGTVHLSCPMVGVEGLKQPFSFKLKIHRIHRILIWPVLTRTVYPGFARLCHVIHEYYSPLQYLEIFPSKIQSALKGWGQPDDPWKKTK